MQLFKNLNQTIYIVLTICGLIFFASNAAFAHTITSNMNPVRPNKQVTFKSTITFLNTDGAIAYIDYGDGTGEKILATQISLIAGVPITYYSTHTYSKEGEYIVRLRTATDTGIPKPPNPAYMTQAVDYMRGITVNRIQLYFENNRPEITIKRNQKSPKLSAKIDFSGTGHLKGYWEIDGTRRSYVFKYLARGPSVVLEYPAVPPIPTFKYGTHNIRFVITDPAMDINFPYAIYFVASDTEKQLAVISLIQPFEGENIARKPLIFKWQPVNKASFYLISIFSKTKQEHVFSAYTRQGGYELRLNILNDRMQSGDEYIWNVVGLNDQNDVIAESIPSVFSFN